MDTKEKKRRGYARCWIKYHLEERLQNVGCPKEFGRFLMLVNKIREQTNLLDCEILGGHVNFYMTELTLVALWRLHLVRRFWVRELYDWSAEGCTTFRGFIGSLARHLLVKNDVPKFLDPCWWSEDESAKQHRIWFRHIGQGNSMRGLRVPGLETRATCEKFLAAPDHFSVADAIVWAQKKEKVQRTPKSNSIYPCGLSRRRQKRLDSGTGPLLWKRMGVRDFELFEYRNNVMNIWEIRQIRTSDRLIEEGRRMRHCVATYEYDCAKGKTTIWSMSRKILDGKAKSDSRVLTIEVLPSRVIFEALGFRNRRARKSELEILRMWAERENLTIDSYVG